MTDHELRELDARLHTLLTGETVRRGKTWKHWYNDAGDEIPAYTADGNAMLIVIRLIRGRGYYVGMRQWTNGQIMASFARFGHLWLDAYGDTFPEAIALAAEKALTAEKDSGA